MTTLPPWPGRHRAGALLVAAVLAACSPTFDWREARPEGSGATLLFPCRPGRHERQVPLAGMGLRMQLHSCQAGGFTFSLAVADTGDPRQVAPVLHDWRKVTIGNVDGTASVLAAPKVVGATPNAESQLLRIDGRRPDGAPVVVHAAFFVKGLRVYQAAVVGQKEPPPRDVLETYFNTIRLSDLP
jgi:hypothetical protein